MTLRDGHYQRINGGRLYPSGDRRLIFEGGGIWHRASNGGVTAFHHDTEETRHYDQPPSPAMFNNSWAALERHDPSAIEHMAEDPIPVSAGTPVEKLDKPREHGDLRWVEVQRLDESWELQVGVHEDPYNQGELHWLCVATVWNVGEGLWRSRPSHTAGIQSTSHRRLKIIDYDTLAKAKVRTEDRFNRKWHEWVNGTREVRKQGHLL